MARLIFFIMILAQLKIYGSSQDYLPELRYKFSLAKNFPSNFSQIVKYEFHDKHIMEVYANNTVVYIQVDQYKSLRRVYFSPSQNITNLKNERFIDIAWESQDTTQNYFLTASKKVISVTALHYSLPQSNITEILTNYNVTQQTEFQITPESIYLINGNSQNSRCVISRRLRQTFNKTRYRQEMVKRAVDVTNTSSDFVMDLNDVTINIQGAIKAKTCNTRGTSWYLQYMIVWNASAYLQFYACDYFTCNHTYTIPNNFLDKQWVINQIKFGATCLSFFVRYDDGRVPNEHYIVNSTTKLVTLWSTFDTKGSPIFEFGPLATFVSIDNNAIGGIIYPNDSLILFKFRNTSHMREYANFGQANQHTRLIRNDLFLCINYQDRLEIYEFYCQNLTYLVKSRGLCRNCSNLCATCNNTNGNCLTCITGYALNATNNKTCVVDLTSSTSAMSTNNDTNNLTSINPTDSNKPSNQSDVESTTDIINETYTINGSNMTNQTPNKFILNSTTFTNQSNLNSDSATNLSNQANQNSLDPQPTITPPDNSSYPLLNQQVSPATSSKYGTHYPYELKLAQTAIQGFQIIGPIIQFTILVLQIMPFAWLFLSFMNFWSICNFYLFLDVETPQYLKVILQIIHDNKNVQIINGNQFLNTTYPFTEKLPQLNAKYGISSSFFVNNIQNFIFFAICMLLTFALFIFLKFIPKNSSIMTNFNHFINFKEIIANQYISITSNFILPFAVISHQLNFKLFKETLNLTLHLIFIIFSLVFPFIFGSILKIKNRKIVKMDLKKAQYVERKNRKALMLKRLDWFYESNCNTLLPLLFVNGINMVCFCLSNLFFVFGLWLASKSGKFRINNMILCCYPILFHCLFVVMVFFGENNIFIRSHCGMLCTMILFLGALHQILSMFAKVTYFVGNQIVKECKKTQNKIDIQKLNDSKIKTSTIQNNLLMQLYLKNQPKVQFKRLSHIFHQKKQHIKIKKNKNSAQGIIIQKTNPKQFSQQHLDSGLIKGKHSMIFCDSLLSRIDQSMNDHEENGKKDCIKDSIVQTKETPFKKVKKVVLVTKMNQRSKQIEKKNHELVIGEQNINSIQQSEFQEIL